MITLGNLPFNRPDLAFELVKRLHANGEATPDYMSIVYRKFTDATARQQLADQIAAAGIDFSSQGRGR